MNQQVKNILSQVYELEGLLLLVENHAKDTDSFVYELIRKKGDNIKELTQNISSSIFESSASTVPSVMPENHKKENLEITQEIEDYPKYEQLGADSNCETDFADEDPEEVYDVDGKVEYTEIEIPEANPIIQIQDSISIDDAPEQLPEDEPQEIWSSEYEEPEKHHDDVEETAENGIDEVVDSDEEELLVEDMQDDMSDDNLRLSDALQRDLSKNLKKAFTLNDRFRYRRELFENSDVQMTNTLNLVETMESFSEAEDYFYGDMEWDKESPEVRDFMEIIKQHFL